MLSVIIFLLVTQSRANRFFDLITRQYNSFSAPIEGHWTHREGHPETGGFELMVAATCH